MPRPPSAIAGRKIFIAVPYKDREEAKRLGAGFEWFKKGTRPAGAPPGYCYIPPGVPLAPFGKWRRIGRPFAPDPTKLPEKTPDGKNAAAVALGRRGGAERGAERRQGTREEFDAGAALGDRPHGSCRPTG